MNFKKISFVFFIIYFFAGLLIFRDYGCTWDDGAQRRIGLANWDYIFNHDNALLNLSDKYHGPAMEILLTGLEKAFHLPDTRDILLSHRLADFLFFYFSMIAFFYCARILMGHDKWALLATLMLVLSPRIFADSFYNSKDITFLSLMIFALFSLLRFIAKPGLVNLLPLCLVTAFAIDVRIPGVIFVPVTLVIILGEIIRHAELRKKYFALVALYPLLLAGFIILFWPALWENPLHNFTEAFAQMRQYPWDGEVLYKGSFVLATNLPWHYLPVWILISTPVFFSLFWFIGGVLIVKNFISFPALFLRTQLMWAIILFLSVGPVVLVILLKSVVYDGWRHLFFIYPFFVLVATYGYKSLAENLSGILSRTVAVVTVLYLGMLVVVGIYMHPFENLYFNFPALICFNPVNKQFEMDYWGLSYKQGLEYLLKSNPDGKTIEICEADGPCIWNSEMLKAPDRLRLNYKSTFTKGGYFLDFHRLERRRLVGDEKIIYEIKRFGNPILTIYKL